MGAQPDTSTSAPEVWHGVQQILAPIFVAKLLATYLVATVLWLAASVLLSLYVGHIASYDMYYGPIGAVVGVMMWFWISAYAVLLGAELNAELELQTLEDTTIGPPKPLGKRGAFVADHIADDS